MTPLIYHNPKCSTSRNALAIMIASGEPPKVIEYLKNPPNRDELVQLLTAIDMTPRALLRNKEPLYQELGLDNPALTDDEIVDAVIAHPRLMNRPIVVTDKGAALCRPLARVFTLLANPVSQFTKENGEVIYHDLHEL